MFWGGDQYELLAHEKGGGGGGGGEGGGGGDVTRLTMRTEENMQA